MLAGKFSSSRSALVCKRLKIRMRFFLMLSCFGWIIQGIAAENDTNPTESASQIPVVMLTSTTKSPNVHRKRPLMRPDAQYRPYSHVAKSTPQKASLPPSLTSSVDPTASTSVDTSTSTHQGVSMATAVTRATDSSAVSISSVPVSTTLKNPTQSLHRHRPTVTATATDSPVTDAPVTPSFTNWGAVRIRTRQRTSPTTLSPEFTSTTADATPSSSVSGLSPTSAPATEESMTLTSTTPAVSFVATIPAINSTDSMVLTTSPAVSTWTTISSTTTSNSTESVATTTPVTTSSPTLALNLNNSVQASPSTSASTFAAPSTESPSSSVFFTVPASSSPIVDLLQPKTAVPASGVVVTTAMKPLLTPSVQTVAPFASAGVTSPATIEQSSKLDTTFPTKFSSQATSPAPNSTESIALTATESVATLPPASMPIHSINATSFVDSSSPFTVPAATSSPIVDLLQPQTPLNEKASSTPILGPVVTDMKPLITPSVSTSTSINQSPNLDTTTPPMSPSSKSSTVDQSFTVPTTPFVPTTSVATSVATSSNDQATTVPTVTTLPVTISSAGNKIVNSSTSSPIVDLLQPTSPPKVPSRVVTRRKKPRPTPSVQTMSPVVIEASTDVTPTFAEQASKLDSTSSSTVPQSLTSTPFVPATSMESSENNLQATLAVTSNAPSPTTDSPVNSVPSTVETEIVASSTTAPIDPMTRPVTVPSIAQPVTNLSINGPLTQPNSSGPTTPPISVPGATLFQQTPTGPVNPMIRPVTVPSIAQPVTSLAVDPLMQPNSSFGSTTPPANVPGATLFQQTPPVTVPEFITITTPQPLTHFVVVDPLTQPIPSLQPVTPPTNVPGATWFQQPSTGPANPPVQPVTVPPTPQPVTPPTNVPEVTWFQQPPPGFSRGPLPPTTAFTRTNPSDPNNFNTTPMQMSAPVQFRNLFNQPASPFPGLKQIPQTDFWIPISIPPPLADPSPLPSRIFRRDVPSPPVLLPITDPMVPYFNWIPIDGPAVTMAPTQPPPPPVPSAIDTPVNPPFLFGQSNPAPVNPPTATLAPATVAPLQMAPVPVNQLPVAQATTPSPASRVVTIPPAPVNRPPLAPVVFPTPAPVNPSPDAPNLPAPTIPVNPPSSIVSQVTTQTGNSILVPVNSLDLGTPQLPPGMIPPPPMPIPGPGNQQLPPA